MFFTGLIVPCFFSAVSPLCTQRGKTYLNVDWKGTDGDDTDAAVASFPASDAWYVGGGLVQPESEQGPQWKSILMKSTDGGHTFTTVMNITSSKANSSHGIGSLLDVECVTAKICYVASTCFDPNCGDRYGAFLHKTIDGGVAWTKLDFWYEMQIQQYNTIWHGISATHNEINYSVHVIVVT